MLKVRPCLTDTNVHKRIPATASPTDATAAAGKNVKSWPELIAKCMNDDCRKTKIVKIAVRRKTIGLRKKYLPAGVVRRSLNKPERPYWQAELIIQIRRQ